MALISVTSFEHVDAPRSAGNDVRVPDQLRNDRFWLAAANETERMKLTPPPTKDHPRPGARR